MDTDLRDVRLTLRGDRAAFGALYQRHVGAIYGYHFRRTEHQQTAEDLTSATFLAAYEGLPTFQSARGAFRGWLFTIARNQLISHLRKAAPTLPLEDFDLACEPSFTTPDQTRSVALALKRLAPLDAELVRLRYWDDLPYQTLSQMYGLSAVACRMRVSRALNQLRPHLQ